VRPSVRELTHTLQLPPAHAEIYGGPHAEWLRDCLEYLPRLQCLLVNGLPFFDHASLLCLRHTSLHRRANKPPTFPVFGLRLLDASGCTNATSAGLAEALSHVPYLVSLDLSRTPAARSEVVLNKLKFLGSLRLLSLKGLGLRDTDFAVVALSIGTRVRSLDVSDNNLTDASARALLENCLKEELVARHTTRGRLPPIEHANLDGDVDAFESENVVAHVRRKLTGGFVGSLAIETVRDVGVTHLFVSKNAMTVEGISGLLRSGRLHVLDIGSLPAMMKQPYELSLSDAAADMELPGVSKLTPVLSTFASTKLKYLRINFEIITRDAPTDVTNSSRAELDGDTEVLAPGDPRELEAIESPVKELDALGPAVYEAPGDTIYPAELHGSSPTTPRETDGDLGMAEFSDRLIGTPASRPNIEVTPEPQGVKRGGAYSPEPVLIDSSHSPISPPQSSFDHHANSVDDNALLSPMALSDYGGHQASRVGSARNRSRHNSSHYVEDRRARLSLQQSQERCFHPGMLPHIHTLVLTDVPTSTTDRKVIHRIIRFIKDAAEEAAIATQRAEHTYALPPGRSRAVAEREHARSIFGLQRIVFEMAPPQAAPKKVSSSWRAYPTKSSTEDPDSETFWEAATHDFSFFGEEECGPPGDEPGRTLPLAAMSGLQLAPEPVSPASMHEIEIEAEPLFDVVSEISNFRKDRKAAYAGLVQMGHANPDLEGYWPGNITVIRKAVDQDAGELDCYGNRYESGWYYR
jgi:hypothetical protein